jgi:hypothetical protein
MVPSAAREGLSVCWWSTVGLEDEVSVDESRLVSAEELGELREEIRLALQSGPLPERKPLMQTLVAEIRVRDRGWIQPAFRVPVFRPPYGSVPPAGPVPHLHRHELTPRFAGCSLLGPLWCPK